VDYPVEVCLDCTYACNARCVHCNVASLADPARQELTASELLGLFAQWAGLGVQRLTLTGGEVLLRPDWEALARAACERFAVTLFTNALAVTPQVAAALAAMKGLTVEVSAYGATEGVYEAVTRAPGSFARFQAGVAALRAARVGLVMKAMLLRQNIHEWEALRAAYGGDGFKWDFRLTPRFDGGRGPVSCRATDRQVFDFLCGSGVRRKRGKAPRPRPDDPVCGAASRGCAVSAYGDVFPCGLWPLSGGNVRDAPFADLWRAEALARVRSLAYRDLPECLRCAALAYCRPCPARNYLETGDLRRPCRDNCRAARLKHAVGQMPGRRPRRHAE
jgi:radical SAM protein with 4Fe4S-binding SPASM domain